MSTPKNTPKVAAARPQLPRSLKALLATLNEKPAPPEIVEEARIIKERVLMGFGANESMVASLLYNKCHYQIPSTAIDTMAVMLLPDGTTMFMYNPYFTVRLGDEGARFVMFHESRHILYRHLFNEPHLRKDPLFTLANEIGINHDTMVRLKRASMPQIAVLDENGQPKLNKAGKAVTEPTGIDPKEQFENYQKDLRKQGLQPVDYADFVRTDYGCYTELKRMSVPPQQDGPTTICVHGDDGEGDPSGSGNGTAAMDDETAEEITKQVLRMVATAAASGTGELARAEILELADRTEGTSERTTKLWGDLGLAQLRGQTQANRKVDWWKQWLNDQLASRLKEGERLIYNKKRGAIDLLLGNDPLLSRRGKEAERLAVVAIDTSGSMPDHVLRYLTQLVGHTDGVEFRWVAFDGVVAPFVPGEAVSGGGGTNFGHVMDYVEGRTAVNGQTLDFHPDVVLMLTDGYASPISPAEPDKWVWLITENGSDDWIQNQGDMVSHKIQTGDGV